MSYFTKDFLSFFEELAGNNHKEWFHANKPRYEEHVKKPFYTFVQDVISEAKKDDPLIDLEVKNAVFRINRDIRFAKDKSPYKTHVAAAISRGGRKELTHPGIYVHLGQDGLHLGSGCHMPDKDQLYNIRLAMSKDLKGVDTMLSNKDFVNLFGEMQGDKHKRIPKEFKPLIDKQPLLANKQFYFYAKHKPKEILRANLLEFVMKHRYAAKPWNQFLSKAMRLK